MLVETPESRESSYEKIHVRPRARAGPSLHRIDHWKALCKREDFRCLSPPRDGRFVPVSLMVQGDVAPTLVRCNAHPKYARPAYGREDSSFYVFMFAGISYQLFSLNHFNARLFVHSFSIMRSEG